MWKNLFQVVKIGTVMHLLICYRVSHKENYNSVNGMSQFALSFVGSNKPTLRTIVLKHI